MNGKREGGMEPYIILASHSSTLFERRNQADSVVVVEHFCASRERRNPLSTPHHSEKPFSLFQPLNCALPSSPS